MPKGSRVVDPLSGSTKNRPSPVRARAKALSDDVVCSVPGLGGADGRALGVWVQAVTRERARLAVRIERSAKERGAMAR
jgi:hypothetical protein